MIAGSITTLEQRREEIAVPGAIGAASLRSLKNTNHATIAVVGGMAWHNTRYSQPAAVQGSQNVAAVMAAADVELFKFSKTNLAITTTVFPAISQPGRVYTNTNMTYYLKFFGNFSWNLAFYGNWDNRPPPGSSGSNYGTSSGLGWTFGNK